MAIGSFEMHEQESILILLARMEGKLDVLVASLDTTNKKVEDHETRLRVVEGRPYITPWKLWTSLLGAVTAVVGLLQIFAAIRGG
jgi:hypothetical protein